MLTEFGIAILAPIITALVLWIWKGTLALPIIRILKKVCGAVANKCRKLKVKTTDSSRQSDENLKVRAEVEDDLHQYNENYRKRHGQLKVSSVGMEAPVPLDDVYVTVQFLDQKRASKYGSVEKIEEAFREESKKRFIWNSGERQDGMKVANDE